MLIYKNVNKQHDSVLTHMTFLLNEIDSGEVHVPLANEIVAVELLNIIARRLNVLPTATFDGAV